MSDVLYQYNPWWEGSFHLEETKPRRRFLDLLLRTLENEQIIFLTGLRRVGKTTLLKLFIRELIERVGVDANRILYFSVDDYLLKDSTLLEVLDEYRKIHRLSVDQKVYVFFDEITYKEEFPQQLKTIGARQNVKMYATSSSRLGLRDGRAFLTGRTYFIELPPLYFDEYLEFKDVRVSARDSKLLETYFIDFMQAGGIPYHVLHGEREYLTTLVDDIIYKDIVSRHGIRNPNVIEDFFLLLMERSGKQLSINKISKILQISLDSAKRYLGLFQDTFLMHLVSRHGTTNERLLSPKKIYCADLGIKHAFTGHRDLGSIFENYVYLLLRPREVSYIYEDNCKLDFYVSDLDMLIEAKYNAGLTEKQRDLYEHYPAGRKAKIDSVYSTIDLQAQLEDIAREGESPL